MNYIVLFASFMALANPVFAANPAVKLKQQTPSATPYETLKQMFDKSKDRIQLQDIGEIRQHCAGAASWHSAPLEVTLTRIKTTKVVVPATPGTPAIPPQGPLFPGKPGMPGVPAQTVTKEGVLAFADDLQVGDWFDNITVESSPTEITTALAGIVNMVDLPFIVAVRKNVDFVTFCMRMSAGTHNEMEYYGYCWEE